MILARYAGELSRAIEVIVRDEADAIARAAALIAGQLRRDGLIYVYGPGAHSAIAVQDVFYRAGCPTNIAPVLDPVNKALASTSAERVDGHGATVVAGSGVGAGDPFIVINAFGVNAAAIGAARSARERGARVIALSSRAASASVPPDHPARAEAAVDLSTLAEVHVDTHVPPADAVLDLGYGVQVGGVSTALNSFVLQAILASAVEELGERARVWRSSYTVGGDAHNAEQAQRLRERVPQL